MHTHKQGRRAPPPPPTHPTIDGADDDLARWLTRARAPPAARPAQNMFLGGIPRLSFLGLCSSLHDEFLRRACLHIESIGVEMEHVDRVEIEPGAADDRALVPYTPIAGSASYFIGGHAKGGFVERWAGTPVMPDQATTCLGASAQW